jgi:hypothetical protein
MTRIVRAVGGYLRFDRASFWVLGLGIPIWILLNAGAVCFGTYFPPIWNDDTAVRALRIGKSGVPVPFIATPLWIVAALVKSCKERGPLMAFAPILLSGGILCVLIAGTFVLHHLRLPAKPAGAERSRGAVHSDETIAANSSSTSLVPPR